jgi:hypothetical protein
VSAADSVTSPETLTGSGTDSGTLTATETQTATVNLGTSNPIAGGSDFDSLHETLSLHPGFLQKGGAVMAPHGTTGTT